MVKQLARSPDGKTVVSLEIADDEVATLKPDLTSSEAEHTVEVRKRVMPLPEELQQELEEPTI